MTTLTASETRIPAEHFNRVAYQNEVLEVRHRTGPSVFVVSESDWKLLEAYKKQREEAVRAASKRVGVTHHETMRKLAQ